MSKKSPVETELWMIAVDLRENRITLERMMKHELLPAAMYSDCERLLKQHEKIADRVDEMITINEATSPIARSEIVKRFLTISKDFDIVSRGDNES